MRLPLSTRRLVISRHPWRAALLALCITGFAAASPTAQAADGKHEALFARVKAAASQGDNPALKYHLGMLLNNGIGTARDPSRAFALFKEAASAGDALAAYKVGCYLAGQFPGVVPVDNTEALAYKQRAAEAGYDLAQYDVGLMLMKRGDRAGAERWLTLASRQGHLEATALLARSAKVNAKDPVQALGLALVLHAGMSQRSAALAERIAAMTSTLDAADRQRAEALQAGWITGQTPLTREARAGMRAVEPLLLAAAPTKPQR